MQRDTRVRVRGRESRVGVVKDVISEQKVRVQFANEEAPLTMRVSQLEVIETDSHANPDPYERLHQGTLDTPSTVFGQLLTMFLDPGSMSSFRSYESESIDHLDYQLLPLIRFLRSPQPGMLIADEVGLGKTIEAIIIWREMQARFRYKRLLVVVPASLREKWKHELREKFGLESEICSANRIHAHIDTPTALARPCVLITSMQGLRTDVPENLEEFDTDTARGRLAKALEEIGRPVFDMVIIDEAHYARNPSSKTYQTLALLTDRSKKCLLLSATPVHTSAANLYTLLSLIDKYQFSTQADVDHLIDGQRELSKALRRLHRSDADAHTIVRALEELAENRVMHGSSLLSEITERFRSLDTPVSNEMRVKTIRRLEHMSPLSEVLSRTLKRDVDERKTERVTIDVDVERTTAEVVVYDLVLHELQQYYDGLVRKRSAISVMMPLRQLSSSVVAALERWRDVGRSREEDSGEESDLTWNEDDEVELSEYQALLRRISDKVEAAHGIDVLRQRDTKYRELSRILSGRIQNKTIVFTYFRDTVSYLADRLTSEGIKVESVMGGMDLNECLQRFKNGSASVLLATDVAAEGVDLQFCDTIVNYDLPWNPMTLEQRIGRIDRRGQESNQIYGYQLVHSGTIDDKIYYRLAKRIQTTRDLLGMLEPIISEQLKTLPERLLRIRGEESLDHDLEYFDTLLSGSKKEEISREIAEEQELLQLQTKSAVEEVQAIARMGRLSGKEDLKRYFHSFYRRWLQEHPDDRSSMKWMDGDSRLEVALRVSRNFERAYEQYCNTYGVPSQKQIEQACKQEIVLDFNGERDRDTLLRMAVDPGSPLIGFAQDVMAGWIRNRASAAVVVVDRHDTELPEGDYAYGIYTSVISGSEVFSDQVTRRVWTTAAREVHSGRLLSREEAERMVVTAMRHGALPEPREMNVGAELLHDLSDLEAEYLHDEHEDAVAQLRAETQETAERRMRYEEGRMERMRSQLDHYRRVYTGRASGLLVHKERVFERALEESKLLLEALRGRGKTTEERYLMSIGIIRVK